VSTVPVEADEAPAGLLPPVSIRGSSKRLADRIFGWLTTGSGIFVLLLMAAIFTFLLIRAVPAVRQDSVNFFTSTVWFPDHSPPEFGIAALLFGTLMTAIIAMFIAVPVGYGVALYTAHYAHKAVAQPMGYIVDLLAAVPSIIYGLWGLQTLMPHSQGFVQWLSDHLSFIPLFKNDLGIYTKSIFIASLVLALMILPTVSAISREVFRQVPRDHLEAATALGATRWETMRLAVFPYARPGMISAAMLGLGRALGETIAVALILSATYTINWHITEPGGNSFAANIALKWKEAGSVGVGALIASGLVLFVITFAVNMVARIIIMRRAAFSGANA
jgi:phosphate transport system permease protein